ncbi:MAG: heavy metal translocating P-type ATPase [Candidatus Zixiibacteriota bacterium]
MEKGEKGEVFEGKWYAHPPMRNAFIAGMLTGISFGLAHPGIIPSLVETAFYIVAIPLGGYHWAREGIVELFKENEIGVKILMLAATIGSAILGMLDEAAFLVALYGAAEGLEEYTYARTRASIRKLLDLAPKEARVIKNGEETIIPAEEIAVGDIFVVRPAESITTDGIIIRGISSINEAPVTGESIPVEKKEGMKVFAATLNQEGALEIKATATFEDNTLAKMVHLVEEAQEEKSKAQLFIERFGRKYSPIVLLSSLLLIIIPPLLGVPVSEYATRAVVLLVAAAPCALVMSTPVAIAAGIGRAGRSGVLIKEGIHLKNLGKIKAIAFDKTGTLTEGKPVVIDVVALNGDESKVLTLAYSEKFSEHPPAQAIVEKAKALELDSLESSLFSALVGSGVKVHIGDETIYVDKPRQFEELGLNSRSIAGINRLRDKGKTAILVGTEESITGIIAIRDEARPKTKGVIDQPHWMGIKVVMLTGDNELTARAIAKELNIDEVRADLKPEDKIRPIEGMEKQYGAVAMMGDGINDAPALARATVGIAMGTAGTDVAIKAADTALMADDLAKVVYAITLGKRARGISNQNIFFSLLILAVLIPSALIGIMTVAVAVVAHEGSELLAVANGLRVATGEV